MMSLTIPITIKLKSQSFVEFNVYDYNKYSR